MKVGRDMADGKWIDGLTPTMSVAEAAREVLKSRMTIVRLALPEAVERAHETVEHVHQLRVGTRRAGAALRIFRDVLPGKVRQTAKKSLRVLRQAAGEARDWDVFILSLASAKPLASAAGKPSLDFLLGYALNERSAAQKHLERAALEIGPDFEEFCDHLVSSIQADRVGSLALSELATEQMGVLFAAFNAEVEADPAEPAELHQLRIQAKRVRYAMEVFVPCFAPPFREVLYTSIENLQEILGHLQDAVVSIDRFESLRERVKAMMPAEWHRLQSGVNGMIAAARRKIPTAKKQFQSWRTTWARQLSEHSLTS